MLGIGGNSEWPGVLENEIPQNKLVARLNDGRKGRE